MWVTFRSVTYCYLLFAFCKRCSAELNHTSSRSNGANFRRTKPVFKPLVEAPQSKAAKKKYPYHPVTVTWLLTVFVLRHLLNFGDRPAALITNTSQVKNRFLSRPHAQIRTQRNFTLQPDQGTAWCPDNGIPMCVCVSECLGEWAEAMMPVARFRMINQLLQNCAALCKFTRLNHYRLYQLTHCVECVLAFFR